jgi:hypothetical protein
MVDTERAPKAEQVEKYYYLSGMLNSALQEMREFSKKKQDGIVSATKIKLLNRLLIEIKTVVEREPSNGYLDLLSEQELPQNSDAVLILGQFQAALKSFESRNHRFVGGATRWVTQEWLAQQRAESEEDDDVADWEDEEAEEGDEDDEDEHDENDDVGDEDDER